MKHIFITGGVVSGLGKGITAASLGRLLKCRGVRVAAQKLDPYMNIDPGAMNPLQHGEVFVTEDGAETDLDLGHYERFIDEDLSKYSTLTSGKVYWSVLNKERNGDYRGQTVQIIPHITDEIKKFIYDSAKASGADVLLTEIGGTVGDIEGQHFLEAARQIALEKKSVDCMFIHVCLVPFISGSGEHKSKPTQLSVKELQSIGIKPDIIIARADCKIDKGVLDKIALFCNVKKDCVIENLTVPCLYEAPLLLHENGFDEVVCRGLKLKCHAPDLTEWRAMVDRVYARNKSVRIAVVGKYVRLHDAYLSIMESLQHAGYQTGAKIEIEWVDSETLDTASEAEVKKALKGVGGIVVPGGSGIRGFEGTIAAAKYARTNNIPYLGICLGMQAAVIEFARNVLGIKQANNKKFAPKGPHSVIGIMNGTMRLGKYPCKIKQGTMLARAYGKDVISERHRNRCEFNNDYRERTEAAGMTVSGTSPDGNIVEAVEIPANNFFVGVQFHPEFKSRPNRPHPLFLEFVRRSMNE